ncbi:thioredoxin domain-containing protein [Novosphingobium sp. TH158]|uniref:thioredoxin domain-containing protein n=1 Tax=Novosphingobium sp. TH158 TaxID=2067455 RepID=UPI000C7CC640|nr:thioredoxin domain-containing protein [Novosphingobium sp. TH158]PLK26546.1 protein-disulfide isomerase [Novosphingobium sp. TH158]
MSVRFVRRIALASTAAVLALGLSACKEEPKEGAAGGTPVVSATPHANVPPPAGKTWADVIEKTADGGYRVGNPNAPVKVVEYGSLSCPHCAKLAQESFETMFGEYIPSGRLSFEFRSFAIHPQDVPMTVLLECGPKESYVSLVEQVYANFDQLAQKTQQGAQAAEQALTLPEGQRFVAMAEAIGLPEFFAQRGISVDQGKACLADFARATKVAQNAEAYGAKGINSTPTLFINDAKLEDTTWNGLKGALQKAGIR